MTLAPLIAIKSTKCESLEAVGKELDRRATLWQSRAVSYTHLDVYKRQNQGCYGHDKLPSSNHLKVR